MPTPDAAPGTDRLAIPCFEPEIHCSPVELFRRLAEGDPPHLLEVEGAPAPWRLAAAARWREGEPLPDGEVVLVDGDGVGAAAIARRLHENGMTRVRALYGGLVLYEFALDPAVVGERRFLEPSHEPR